MTRNIIRCVIYVCLLMWGSSTYVTGYREVFDKGGLAWLEYDDEDHTSRLRVLKGSPSVWFNNSTKEFLNVASKYDRMFTHVTVDMERETFVVSDRRHKTITGISLVAYGLSNFWEIFTGTSRKVNDVAVDWVSDVVYWTDAAYDAIFISKIYLPAKTEILIDTDLDEPHGIVTYPEKGFLFWTDSGRGRIERSSLSGRNRIVLISGRNLKPTSLTIDYESERLFWVQSVGNTIQWCSLHGGRAYHLQKHNFLGSNIFSLDFLDGFLMASRQKDREIRMMSVLSSSREKLQSTYKPYGIVTYSGTRYSSHDDPCAGVKCPGICVTAHGYTPECVCRKHAASPGFSTDSQLCSSNPVKSGSVLLTRYTGLYHLVRNFAEFDSAFRPTPTMLIGGRNRPTAIASNVWTSTVYFFESNLGVIQKVQMDNSSVSEAIVLAVKMVEGLAVDWITGNIYWTDSAYSHIMVARRDGQFPLALITSLNKPKAIVVHSPARYMFWSDVGNNTIERSDLDGSSRRIIIKPTKWEIFQAVAMTIDFLSNRLYWCDRPSSSIYSSNLDGTGVRFILMRWTAMFTGLSIMNDYIIWSDIFYRNEGVYAADKKTGRVKGSSAHDFNYTYGLTFHHASNQPWVQNQCSIENGGCDQLCLPNNPGFRCDCTYGYNLVHGHKCEVKVPESNWFLIFADQRQRKLFQTERLLNQNDDVVFRHHAIPVQLLKQPYGVAYDPVERKIYWSDVQDGTISRALANGDEHQIIYSDANDYATHIVLDVSSRLIYFVVSVAGKVGVISLKTLSAAFIAKGFQEPFGLDVHPSKGLLFVTHRGYPRINLSSMDGKVHFNITYTVGQPKGIAVLGEDLYWVDAEEGVIKQSSLNGENVVTILEVADSYLNDVAVDSNHVYWTDMNARSLKRIPFGNGNNETVIGEENVFFRLGGIAVDNQPTAMITACADNNGGCGEGMCLPTPSGPRCWKHATETRISMQKGLCTVPHLPFETFTSIRNNVPGNVVPNGFILDVVCLPLHQMTSFGEVVCRNGNWSDIPKCELQYKIYGHIRQGFAVFNENASFYTFGYMRPLDVICIGGGGGGFDISVDEFALRTNAGNGGDSSFGTYLFATGGKGGSYYEGGEGGMGSLVNGGKGSTDTPGTCTTGGAAGQLFGGPTTIQLFCGSGGSLYRCPPDELADVIGGKPGDCGNERNGSAGGMFGGGAGNRGGGAGGGGGYSRSSTVKPGGGEVVEVTVGEGGQPSFAPAGTGAVIVAWGMTLEDVCNSYHDIFIVN